MPTLRQEVNGLVLCHAPGVLRYMCTRGMLDNDEPRCLGFGGVSVEAAVVASEGAARQQDDVLQAWQRELEAARYTAQRAQRQYDAADPENRSVAEELERRWNQALQRVAEIETRIAQHLEGPQQVATPTQRSLKVWRPTWRRCGTARTRMCV